MLRPRTFVLFAGIALLAIALTVSATDRALLPGDPVGPDDLIFVDLDSSDKATCGVTKANNIRCWGNNRFAPVRAEGFTDVAVGTRFSCGIKLDGTVECWGRDWLAVQLTPPTETDGSAIRFASIDSMQTHICGIRSDNQRVNCWGYNNFGQSSGQLPTGSSPFFLNNSVPYNYSAETFSHIRVGVSHTCGILADGANAGQVKCWGSDEHGESTIPQEHSSTVFKTLDAGDDFTCALIGPGAQEGKPICWGYDFHRPVSETPDSERFIEVSAGTAHACGITTDGTALCWGDASSPNDDYGQIDVPTKYQSATFNRIIAAQYHTCGILDGQNGQAEGEVVCWGAEFTADPLTPGQVDGGLTTPPDFFYPPVTSLPEVDTGIYFNCALTQGNDLICWGGSSLKRSFTKGPFKTLAVGEQHTCGVKESGHVICWGFNNNLQAKGSTGNPSDVPESKKVQNLATDYTFKSVSAAYFHTCGILDGRTASQTDGEVLCWGHDSNGQATPPDGATFSRISVGLYHGCGLLDGQNGQSAGQAVCWGAQNDLDANNNVVPTVFGFNIRADFGQADIPAKLVDKEFISISAGRYHTCAVRSDTGAVECWGLSQNTEIPEELTDERFSSVSVSSLRGFTCGITEGNRVRCWGPGEQHHVPEEYVDADFASVSASVHHVCATQTNGRVFCWGADADTSTPEIDIYKGSTIVNTRQAWVPRSFRARPPVEGLEEGPRPPASVRILRIEPTIRDVTLSGGDRVRLDVEVYGRQDIRDDSLGDRPEITFEWIDGVSGSTQVSGGGTFEESVALYDDRESNGQPDDRRVLYTSPSNPGRYFLKAMLEPGTECLGKREGETDEDVVERCTAIFDLTVRRVTPASPTPVPPSNPAGEIPDVIVDDAGTNYEVFTPEDGGEFVTERCSLKLPKGAVNNSEIIGVHITELETADEQVEIADLRFMTDGIQCDISAVDANGEAITDYQLLKPGNICMPLPDRFRPMAVDAFVGAINSDSTLTALSSKLYLATSAGELNVCGNISSLSATTTVALRAEVAGELPPTPVPTPDVAELDTGGLRLSEIQGLIAMLVGVAILALAVGLVFGRRRDRDH